MKSKKKLGCIGILLIAFFGVLFMLTVAAAIVPSLVVTHIVPIVASEMLDTDVKIKSATVNVFTGGIAIKEMTVKNYPKYNTPYAFKLNNFLFQIDIPSLFTDKIEIKRLKIDGLMSSLEFKSLTQNNLNDMIKKVKSEEAEEFEEEAKEKNTTVEEVKSKKKKMVIREFSLTNSTITLQNQSIGIPNTRLKNVGDGQYAVDFIGVVFDTVIKIILNIAGSITTIFTEIFK